MEILIVATSRLKLDYEEGCENASVINTEVALEVSKNINKSTFFDEGDIPNFQGARAVCNALVQGLIANLHFAHQHGLWDSAKHLRYIIDAPSL
jgi:hypothetical protein